MQHEAKQVRYDYHALVAEYDRRVRIRQTSAANRFSMASAGIALVAVIVGIIMRTV